MCFCDFCCFFSWFLACRRAAFCANKATWDLEAGSKEQLNKTWIVEIFSALHKDKRKHANICRVLSLFKSTDFWLQIVTPKYCRCHEEWQAKITKYCPSTNRQAKITWNILVSARSNPYDARHNETTEIKCDSGDHKMSTHHDRTMALSVHDPPIRRLTFAFPDRILYEKPRHFAYCMGHITSFPYLTPSFLNCSFTEPLLHWIVPLLKYSLTGLFFKSKVSQLNLLW